MPQTPPTVNTLGQETACQYNGGESPRPENIHVIALRYQNRSFRIVCVLFMIVQIISTALGFFLPHSPYYWVIDAFALTALFVRSIAASQSFLSFQLPMSLLFSTGMLYNMANIINVGVLLGPIVLIIFFSEDYEDHLALLLAIVVVASVQKLAWLRTSTQVHNTTVIIQSLVGTFLAPSTLTWASTHATSSESPLWGGVLVFDPCVGATPLEREQMVEVSVCPDRSCNGKVEVLVNAHAVTCPKCDMIYDHYCEGFVFSVVLFTVIADAIGQNKRPQGVSMARLHVLFYFRQARRYVLPLVSLALLYIQSRESGEALLWWIVCFLAFMALSDVCTTGNPLLLVLPVRAPLRIEHISTRQCCILLIRMVLFILSSIVFGFLAVFMMVFGVVLFVTSPLAGYLLLLSASSPVATDPLAFALKFSSSPITLMWTVQVLWFTLLPSIVFLSPIWGLFYALDTLSTSDQDEHLPLNA